MAQGSQPAINPLIIDGKHKQKETEWQQLAVEQAADDASSTSSLSSFIRQASKKVKHTMKKAGLTLTKASTAVKNLTQCKKAVKPATGTGKPFSKALSLLTKFISAPSPESMVPISTLCTKADNESLPALEEY